MDWGRAKNIILVVLVVTNIFLISVYGIKYEQNKENNSELYRYTIEKLKENQIELDCEIPEKPERMPALTVRYEKYDSARINREVEAAGETDSVAGNGQEMREAADELIATCGLDTEGASVAETEENEDGSTTVRYGNYYHGIPLQECYMNVVFRDGKISRLERKWMEPVEEGKTRIEVTEPATALLRFIEIIGEERAEKKNGQTGGREEAETASGNEKEETVTVSDMYLTYYVNGDEIRRNILYDTAFPAWCIEYGDGQIRYISAYEQ